MALFVRPGASPELRDLADAIEAAQQPEIDQMTAMLEEWVRTSRSPMGATPDIPRAWRNDVPGGDGCARRCFWSRVERMWMTMMIGHHEGAIAMSEIELDHGVNGEAQALAEQIVDVQETEIAQMQAMLDEMGY